VFPAQAKLYSLETTLDLCFFIRGQTGILSGPLFLPSAFKEGEYGMLLRLGVSISQSFLETAGLMALSLDTANNNII
jgi:hypothetical protein